MLYRNKRMSAKSGGCGQVGLYDRLRLSARPFWQAWSHQHRRTSAIGQQLIFFKIVARAKIPRIAAGPYTIILLSAFFVRLKFTVNEQINLLITIIIIHGRNHIAIRIIFQYRVKMRVLDTICMSVIEPVNVFTGKAIIFKNFS